MSKGRNEEEEEVLVGRGGEGRRRVEERERGGVGMGAIENELTEKELRARGFQYYNACP